MKIAVIGTGFVAQGYLRALNYLGYHPMVLSRSWLDYTNVDKLRFFMESYTPDVMVNCAGFTGRTVDDCETNRAECLAANAELPSLIATLCQRQGCSMVHVSSGCIFDGSGPFRESDGPNFTTNCYQQSKLAGENAVMKLCAGHWIFRIRMPFSHIRHPRNWLCKLASYPMILDGLNSVTWLDEFCMRSWQILRKSQPGIYHCTQPNPVRTLAVAKLLNPVCAAWKTSDFMRQHVKRSSAVLDCSKFEAVYGTSGTDSMSAIKWCAHGLFGSHDRKTTDLQKALVVP